MAHHPTLSDHSGVATHGSARSDRTRQWLVLGLAVLAIVAAFIGSGAAGGTPIQEAAGGALSSDSTLIAPAGPAFSIWSVIYAGLLGYAIWQLIPAQAARPRQRAVGYWVAASLLLNAAWILTVQFGSLALSVVMIVALLVVLVSAFSVLRSQGPESVVEAILLDGTMGLYLGWVAVATVANVTALLVAAGFTGFGIGAEVWSVAVIAVTALIGLLLAVWSGGRLSPAAALAWGLAWIAVSRVTGELTSVPTAVAAGTAAAAVILVTVIVRLMPVERRVSGGSQRGSDPATSSSTDSDPA